MANPFLVLGGIAISVVTAAFGVLAVPGWVAAAQDASTINDLANIRSAQAVAVSADGTFFADIETLRSGTAGVEADLSGTDLIGIAADGGDAWCAAIQSPAGGYFAASPDGVSKRSAAHPGDAMTSAQCNAGTSNTILDSAYGPVTSTRTNLAVNPVGGAWNTKTDEFGFLNNRWSSFGTYSFAGAWARFTPTSDAYNLSYGINLAFNPEGTVPINNLMPAVAAGETYTVSLKARYSAGHTGTAVICWRFANEATTWVSNMDCQGHMPVTAAASPVTGTFTVPAGATRAALYVRGSSVPLGTYFEATELLVEKSATFGTYFDGGTVRSNLLQHISWAGTPNASRSVLVTRAGRD